MRLVERLRTAVRTKRGRVIIDFAFITFLAVVIFRNFLFTNEWPAGGDVLGWISRSYLFGKDFRWLYVWHPYSFGFVEGINSLDLFFSLIYFVCRDASCTIKIFMFSSFLTAGFSMYAFAYRYTRKHIAALSASLIYILNQWFFSQFTEAHIGITFSYALAPLLFLLLDKALKTRKFRGILILALGLSVFVTGFHPECIVIYGIFLALFVVFHTLLPTKPEIFRTRIENLLKISLPVVVICFLLSAFWLIPFVFNVRASYYSPAYVYPLEDAFTWSYRNVVDAFTLRAVESGGYTSVVDVPGGLSLPDFPVSIFLLFLFGLSYCTIFLRRDKYTIFFLVSAVVSVFLSKGPYPPFGYVFTWAWFNVPHFAVFRGANRWVMMAAFSHAFFVSILVSAMIGYVQKKHHLQANELFVPAKTNLSERAQVKKVYVSFDVLNRLCKKLHMFLYYFSLIVLILIFLSGFLSCSFFFSQGLQVYTPPRSYLEPYEWIANQHGDYKVVTVGQGSDFASQGVITDIGWGHDVGFESSFIHDKPALQNGGWEPLALAFVDYLRFQLVRQNMTDDLLKMLGTLNYKYIVLPPYASASVRDFFLNQQGGHVVYNQSSIILENEFYTPRIFVPAQHVVVVGGLESFNSLSKIDSFSFDETAMVFAHQIDENSLISHSLFNGSRALIFVDSELLDLIMLSLEDDACFINAAEYGVSSINDTKYWVRSLPWRTFGGLVLGGNILTTCGKNSVNIPFMVNSDDMHDIWVRVEFAPDKGKLSVSVDGNLGEEIEPRSNFLSRFLWVNVTRLYLGKGKHIITLSNDGTGCNDVDSIAVINPSVFQTKRDEVLNFLRTYLGRLIYMLEAENAFAYNLSSGWSLVLNPYNGFVLHTKGLGANVSPEGTASASSVADLEAQNAIDENLNTRWASSYGLPQWLQVEWGHPQELSGVRIVFHHACARQYLVQTWTGANWIDQLSISENTLLERTHRFQHPVQTTKLRIYMTSAPDYNCVSIWELEAYTAQGSSASTNVFVPREGNYIVATRLNSRVDYGGLNITIDNVATVISCGNSGDEFEWYESEPIFLDAGEQTLSIDAFGDMDVDELVLFSLEDGESMVPLDHLFRANSVQLVGYKKVNPCEYNVHVNSEEPFVLIFSDAYHPLWRAYVNNVEASPIIAYSFVNGFFVNKTGKLDIRLYFTGQTYANIGLRVSTITIVATVVCLIIPSNVFRKLHHRAKKLVKSRRKTKSTCSREAA